MSPDFRVARTKDLAQALKQVGIAVSYALCRALLERCYSSGVSYAQLPPA